MASRMRDFTGAAAPPMANGEVIFEAPWQGRVFGMATALSEAGAFEWDDFRDALIAAIDAWSGDEYRYFDCFLTALEAVLADKALVDEGELAGRVGEFNSRPHDHDHA